MSQLVNDKFPWESDIPNGKFWETLQSNIGRKMLRVFNADEIAAMNLDDKAGLDERSKLELLEPIVRKRIETQPLPAPPEILSHDGFEEKWHRQQFLLAHILRDLGGSKAPEAEQRYQRMIKVWAKRDDPDKKWSQDMSSMDCLIVLYQRQERYPEAEQTARSVIKLIRECPSLGYGSPMNLGVMLKLMDALGKQGKYEEALALNEEGRKAVLVLSQSKFAKYEEEMAVAMDKKRAELEEWKKVDETTNK